MLESIAALTKSRSSTNGSIDCPQNEYYIQRMSTENVKTEAIRLLQRLPDDVTWDDLMHEIYVRQSIEAGLADSKAGKTVDVTAVRKQFGLPS